MYLRISLISIESVSFLLLVESYIVLDNALYYSPVLTSLVSIQFFVRDQRVKVCNLKGRAYNKQKNYKTKQWIKFKSIASNVLALGRRRKYVWKV